MKENAHSTESEIDLIGLVSNIWSQRRFIYKVSAVFLVLGVIIAFTAKVEYVASSRLMPESQEGASPDLGGLGGLAGLAGINLNLTTSGALTPDIYPEMVRSAPFLIKLVETPIYFEKLDTTLTSFYYFKEIENSSLFELIFEYTLGLPFKIKESMSSGQNEPPNHGLIRFSKKDWKIIEEYADRLSVSVDTKTGIISVSTKMPDPVAAAKLATILIDELTKNVTNYKIEKARVNLDFVQERFDEAQKVYKAKQEDLAVHTDRNKNISNAIVQIEHERLQNEVSIAFEVYKGLASQLEQSKIKVKEETPVFTILEPVKIPSEKSSPIRSLYMLGFLFLGVVGSISFIIFKQVLHSFGLGKEE